jgi:hypothetical protein
LQGNDITSLELLIVHQVLPVLCFDIEAFNRIPAEDVASISQRNDMCVVREHFVRHRIHILAFVIPDEVELDQFRALERFAVDGIRAMLLDPREYVGQVKNRSIDCAYRMLERL